MELSRVAWHSTGTERVLGLLQSDLEKGLDSAEARRRLLRHGLNEIKGPRPPGAVSIFLSQFASFMVVIMLAATVASIFLGETRDSLVILAIVLINATLGFVQEFRAERSMEALKTVLSPTATVTRDGRKRRVDGAELVPGDVVEVAVGDRVPADLRLVETVSLEVDESTLTGESVPVPKGTRSVEARAPLAERSCMAFMGTVVTRGKGRGVVVASGMATELGTVADLVLRTRRHETPLTTRMDQLGRWLVAVCGLTCGVVVLLGLTSGQPVRTTIMIGISLAVAAVPEGLPAIVTVALARGVQRMSRRKAIIRKLDAVETLGSTTVICSDKTGTLTTNQMTLTALWTASGEVAVEGRGWRPHGAFTRRGERIDVRAEPELLELLTAAALCNDAELVPPRSKADRAQWAVRGDPTEGALLVAAAKAGLARADLLKRRHLVAGSGFDPERRMMSVVFKELKGRGRGEDRGGRGGHDRVVSYVKGAPDTLLAECSHVLVAGEAYPLDEPTSRQALQAVSRMVGGGLRVLGVARKELAAGHSPAAAAAAAGRPDAADTGLTLLGFAGMHDPPRPEVAAAIVHARQAGVRTVMLTGDHPATAVALARQVGLAGTGDHAAQILTGRDIDSMSDARLLSHLASATAFARVTPAHKLRIVRLLRKAGHVVAMTGDGVNDAPALREADIGVAMGVSGTDVTRETSDMVLADDNYATIVAAVEEGRGVYDSIVNFIGYLLACNVGEVLTMFAAGAARLAPPLVPAQILWMNLVTDGLPALALGLAGPDPRCMRRPPRDPRASVFSGGLMMRICLVGLAIAAATLAGFLFELKLGSGGASLDRARTVAFSVLVGNQLAYVLRCGRPRPWRGRAEGANGSGPGRDPLQERSCGRPLRPDRGPRARPRANPYLAWAVAASAAMQLAAVSLPSLNGFFKTVPLSGPEWALVALLSALPLVFPL